MTISVEEFEDKVWELEGVRVTIRAPKDAQVNDYDYQRATTETFNVSKFLRDKIVPRLNGHEAVVIQGDGEEPNGRTLLRNVRPTYKK
ncbi:hypothetical protein ACET69_20780 [Aeromonas veronii]